jgi:superfamily II DNA or RNA helicase
MDKFLDLIKTTNTKVKEVQNYYMNIAEDMKKEYKINRAVLNPYYARADKLKIKADMLIQDEVHKEYATERTKKILGDLEPEFRIGLSATPWNESGYALFGAEVIETASCEDLTNMNYLSKINYYIPRWAEKVEYGAVEKSGGDYNLTSLGAIIASPKHLNKLVKAMDSMNAKQLKTLVFCSNIEQCDKIEEILVKSGYSAAAYHSKKSEKENKRIMHSFKNNGGYILHFDATTEIFAGKVNIVFRDSLSKHILLSIEAPSEKHLYIIPALEEIKKKYGTPLMTMSDLKSGSLTSSCSSG